MKKLWFAQRVAEVRRFDLRKELVERSHEGIGSGQRRMGRRIATQRRIGLAA